MYIVKAWDRRPIFDIFILYYVCYFTLYLIFSYFIFIYL